MVVNETTGRRVLIAILFLLLAGCCRQRAATLPGRIVLVPIGPVPADVLALLQRELPRTMRREVVIGSAIPLPAQAFDEKRRQYLGDALLGELARHDVAGASRILGVIDSDAYAPGLNFILGQARLPGRYAVIALPRLRGSRGDPARFQQRVVKDATHELGHTAGIRHCEDRTCVMHFSNAIAEMDEQTSHFCKRDEERLFSSF
jgi:archaemetzincin